MVDGAILTRRDVSVLSVLTEKIIKNKLGALPVNKLLQITNGNALLQSEPALRRSLRRLVSYGLVSEGIKYGRQKTYYISPKGIDFLEELELEAIVNMEGDGK